MTGSPPPSWRAPLFLQREQMTRNNGSLWRREGRATQLTQKKTTKKTERWIERVWCSTHFSSFVFDPWCPAGPLSASGGRPGSLALQPHYQLICHSNGEWHTRHCAWMGTIWQHLPAHSFPRVETKRDAALHDEWGGSLHGRRRPERAYARG